jgi:hypothetical protein
VTEATGAEREPGEPGLSLAGLAWLLAALAFVALRVGAAFTLPVFGMELDHLSGAWQASIGQDDHRYVPTLFQAISAFFLWAGTGELAPRLLAVVVAATMPLCAWFLRRDLGDGGAFLVLLALALDPVSVALTASGNAAAFDLPLALWLYVGLRRRWLARIPVAAAAGLLAASSGPLPLLLLVAALVTARQPQRYWRALAAGGLGAAVALVLASARFGLGFEELVFPPLDILAAGSERRWSTPTAAEVAILYNVPILIAAGLSVAAVLARVVPRPPGMLSAWLAISAGWWVFSIDHHGPLPAAAVALPAALFLGQPAACALASARRVDLRFAAAGLGIMAFFGVILGANIADWARLERPGDGSERALVALLCLGALVGVGLLVWARATAALAVPALMAAIAFLTPGALELATGGAADPLASPFSPVSARDLRDLALESRATTGLEIVVHPDLAEDVTWPFRDSGVLLVASRIPPAAGFVLWPADAPAPEGFVRLEGSWALTRRIRAPTADGLDYLHWLLDRNTLASRPEGIAVYTRPGQ